MAVESTFVQHEPCPSCGSSDNLARYSDGHAVCFSGGCNHYEHGNGQIGQAAQRKPMRSLEMTGVIAAIPDRRISQSTCQRYGVTVEYGTDGQIVKHHYPYHNKDTGTVTGTKVRITETKSFYATGEFNEAGLFGQQALRQVAVNTSRSQKARRTHLLSTRCSTESGQSSPSDQVQPEQPKTSKRT